MDEQNIAPGRKLLQLDEIPCYDYWHNLESTCKRLFNGKKVIAKHKQKAISRSRLQSVRRRVVLEEECVTVVAKEGNGSRFLDI
jgi:hypothetical protein